MKKDKPILVTEPLLPNYNFFCKRLKKIWDKKWLTNNGEFHQEFEKKLLDILNVNNVSLFCNGHMALSTALKALDLEGEVITTPYTFASTTHAIVENGLTPVFCDIDPETFVIDADKIEELITDKTCAILPVHVYGNICDVKKIDSIAKKYNLKVIYDAAHAFFETIDGNSIATYGDITMFSFHATKVFNTIEGGALCYNDCGLKNKIEMLKNFGIQSVDDVELVGLNSKMNEFSALMGLCNLNLLGKAIKKRKLLTEKYVSLLSDCAGISINSFDENYFRNYSYFPIVIDEDECGFNRDELSDFLKENNVYVRKYFYPLITECSCYKNLFDSKLTPIALDISRKILTLPLYDKLSLAEVEKICSLIKQFISCNRVDIDVYMLTYNHEKYIRQALGSVLAQKLNVKYRILISDDCSTDKTRDILKQYQSKYPNIVKVFFQKDNVGMKKNAEFIRDKLIAPYVVPLEGDDYWIDNNKLQKQYDFLKKNKEYSAYASSVWIVDKKGKRNLDLEKRYSNYCYKETKDFFLQDALMYVLPGQTASMMYRNIYKNFTPKQKRAYNLCKANGDQKMTILSAIEGKIYCSSEVLAAHRKVFDSGDSWSFKVKDKNMAKYHYDAIKDIEKLLREYFDLDVEMKEALYARFEEALNSYVKSPTKENKKILRYIFIKEHQKRKMMKRMISSRLGKNHV